MSFLVWVADSGCMCIPRAKRSVTLSQNICSETVEGSAIPEQCLVELLWIKTISVESGFQFRSFSDLCTWQYFTEHTQPHGLKGLDTSLLRCDKGGWLDVQNVHETRAQRSCDVESISYRLALCHGMQITGQCSRSRILDRLPKNLSAP